jgi:hypothetical protein
VLSKITREHDNGGILYKAIKMKRKEIFKDPIVSTTAPDTLQVMIDENPARNEVVHDMRTQNVERTDIRP